MPSEINPQKRFLVVCFIFFLSLMLAWLVWQPAALEAAGKTGLSVNLDSQRTAAAVDCGVTPWSVSTSADWNDAVSCFNSQIGGAYEISFQADILLTGTTNINNSTGASLSIHGNGYSLDGDATYLVIQMDNGIATMDALTVTNGRQTATNSQGAGIRISNGAFTVTNSAILANSALGHGGGIYAGSNVTLTVQNSEIAYNETRYVATRSGAGIYLAQNAVATVTNSLIHDNESEYYGGGIHNQKGTLTVINSAIYDNDGRNGGGGIATRSGETYVINSTISDNTRSNGSGGEGLLLLTDSGDVTTIYLTHTTVISNENSNIYSINLNSSATPYVYLYNSIVGNATDQNCEENSTGDHYFIASYSLADDNSCLTDGVDGNLVADPQEEPLQDNGGDTMTHALPWESPAVNAIPFGTNGCGTTYTIDQRGEARPNASGCDIGAFELIYCAGSPYLVNDTASLGVGIECHNATTSGGTVISFTSDIVLTETLPNIDNSYGNHLLINGNGHSIDGDATYLVMRMENGITTIDTLTVTNGRQTATNSQGAGIRISNGAFTVTNSAILGNSALGHGGGIYAGSGVTLTVQNSEIAYNETRYVATRSGAGIYLSQNAVATVTNSLIHDNESEYYGGGIHNQKGTLTVINSALYDNDGRNGGGGIATRSGETRVINSTISGNTRSNGSGGEGLLLLTDSGDVTTIYLTHTTVISNENSNIYSINLNSSATPYVYLYNSIVGNATDQNCDENSTGNHYFIASYSLGDDSSCLNDGVNGNIVADPQEEPLQDNGGNTMTHALGSGSPAINQIPFGTNGCGTTYTTDQRGEDRFSANCDMGAYEFDYCTAVEVFGVEDEANLNWAIDCFNGITSGQKTISLTADVALVTDTTTIENSNDVILNIDGNGLAIDGGNQGRTLKISGTEVNIQDITLINGQAGDGTGGALNFNGGSVFTLTNSTLSNNTATSGGGLYVSNSHGRIVQTTINDNEATGYGGGGILARDGSQLEIIDTAIISNSAPTIAGGIRTTVDSILTATNTLIAYNEATTDAGGVNANQNSTITLINSTVSHNQAGQDGGGIYARGTVNLLYTTVASNTAVVGDGDGLFIYNANTQPTLEGVLLAYNNGENCSRTDLVDNGSNLSDDGSCSFGGGLNSIDPLLEPLTDNGGETESHALVNGSPAIDQIENGVDGCGTTITADQRGVTRPLAVTAAGGCDIGAFERAAFAVSPNITIHQAGGMITINWALNGSNESYDLYRSTTPYGTYSFLNDDVTPQTEVSTGGSETIYFYQVVANGYGLDTAESNEVGVFHFSLKPGE